MQQLTEEQKNNIYLIVASIWGKSVADNISINSDVHVVVMRAVDAMTRKSQIIKDFVIAITGVTGSLKLGVISKGADLAQFILERCWIGNLNVARLTAASQYRPTLEMASSGLGIWI